VKSSTSRRSTRSRRLEGNRNGKHRHLSYVCRRLVPRSNPQWQMGWFTDRRSQSVYW